MARSSVPPAPKPAELTPAIMKSGIPKLVRRIEELRDFDVLSIEKRGDPAAEMITKRINGTLRDILGHDTIEYEEYQTYSLDTLPLRIGGWPASIETVREGYQEGIDRALAKLQALKLLFEEHLSDLQTPNEEHNEELPAQSTQKVFVVHGHDVTAKLHVARFLEKLALNPIILHEQTNQGRTIIEKFEANASVSFAVVLLTPDDFGYPSGKPELGKPRARQNVIMELGFFLGHLGRGSVAVLYKEGVEIPSDYQGVAYILMDEGGGWNFRLAGELKAAGLEVDLNRIA
jgi:predicted nucleotide-binding protein